MKTAAFITALAILPPAADALALTGLPAALAEKVAAARQACAGNGNGEFALEWGAVTRTDLDGDFQPDWVLDESAYACSTAVSMFCSTGGCMSHFLVGDVVASFLNQGWTVLTFGRNRVLLTDVHGTDCGGINPTPCFVARAWDPEVKVWRSVEAGIEWRRLSQGTWYAARSCRQTFPSAEQGESRSGSRTSEPLPSP